MIKNLTNKSIKLKICLKTIQTFKQYKIFNFHNSEKFVFILYILQTFLYENSYKYLMKIEVYYAKWFLDFFSLTYK